MKPVYAIKLLAPLASVACCLFGASANVAAAPADCHGNWQHPVEQHVEMRGMSLSLEEYANDERHFSIKQAAHVLDIYFLKEALLIKGPTTGEIEQYSEEELSWFPMVLAIPNSVLSSLSPKGPCSLKGKTQFSQHLDGNLGFGQHKLTFVEGNVSPSGPSELAYSFAATVTPPLEGVSSIQYSGSMRFASKAKPLAATTNLTGYTLIGSERPLPVVGDASLRLSTVGELRTLLAQREPMDEDSGAEPHF
ncbi:MAG TPA: hypothetical protein VIF60_23660 [Burkholderiaceae bacterium]|jgi:hypothetical protein